MYKQYKTSQAAKTFYKDRKMNKNLLPILHDIPNGSRVIDVGCGNGRLMSALKDKKCSVAGIDIAPPAVELARQRGLDAYLGDVDDPDDTLAAVLDQNFDVATFCKSLIYVQYPHRPYPTPKSRNLVCANG